MGWDGVWCHMMGWGGMWYHVMYTWVNLNWIVLTWLLRHSLPSLNHLPLCTLTSLSPTFASPFLFLTCPHTRYDTLERFAPQTSRGYRRRRKLYAASLILFLHTFSFRLLCPSSSVSISISPCLRSFFLSSLFSSLYFAFLLFCLLFLLPILVKTLQILRQ